MALKYNNDFFKNKKFKHFAKYNDFKEIIVRYKQWLDTLKRVESTK